MSYQDRLKRNITLSRIRIFFISLLFFMPIWYAFERHFASAEALAFIYGATHLVSVFLELPTGALADLIGRKRVVFLGLLIHGGSFILLSQSQNISWIWIGYILCQIGNTFISGADTALYYDTLKELKKEDKFTLYISQNELIYRVGLTLASIAGGYIYLSYFRLPYFLVGVVTIIAAVITLFMIEPHIDSEKFTLPNYLKQTKLGFSELWKTPYVRDLSLYYVSISGVTWYYLYYLLNAFTTDVGFLPVERGWLSAINSLLVGGLGVLIAKYKLFSRKTTFLFFPTALLLGFLIAPFIPKPYTAIPIFILYLASIFRWTYLDKYTNEEFESKYRATAISALSMSTSIVYFILSFALIPILTRHGNSWVMFSLGVIVFFTAVPTTIVLLKKHRER